MAGSKYDTPGRLAASRVVADLYAAMAMMRLLRHEIAASLSLTSAEYSVLLAVWYLERGRISRFGQSLATCTSRRQMSPRKR